MKNFKFDSESQVLTIGEIELSRKMRQYDIDTLGCEHYSDYQDKYIYTLKQWLDCKDNKFKVTLVFKGSTIWLIEIKHANAGTENREKFKGLYQELYHEILATKISEAGIEIVLKSILRIEYK